MSHTQSITLPAIGVHPGLIAKPHMLGRFARDHGLKPVVGNHMHLVADNARNPIAITKPKQKAIVRKTFDWTPGGNAA